MQVADAYKGNVKMIDVEPNTLTFTRSNWNHTQTVTAQGVPNDIDHDSIHASTWSKDYWHELVMYAYPSFANVQSSATVKLQVGDEDHRAFVWANASQFP